MVQPSPKIPASKEKATSSSSSYCCCCAVVIFNIVVTAVVRMIDKAAEYSEKYQPFFGPFNFQLDTVSNVRQYNQRPSAVSCSSSGLGR